MASFFDPPPVDLSAIDNETFIRSVFEGIDPDSRPVATGFRESPNQTRSGWKSKIVNGTIPASVTTEHNNYYSIAAIRAGDDGTHNRVEANFDACFAIVLDDIGANGKVSADSIKLAPSYEIETSPDNSQFGYILKTPCRDLPRLKQIFEQLKARNLTDQMGVNPVRWVRLPVGVNTKAEVVELNGEPFQCALGAWHPERRFELEEIIDGLELAVVDAPAGSGNLGGFAVGAPKFDSVVANTTIQDGADLHDTIRDMAASYVAKGLDQLDIIEIIQNKVSNSNAVKDERYWSRYNDIPRAVHTAHQKGFAPEIAVSNREVNPDAVPDTIAELPMHLRTIAGALQHYVDYDLATAVTKQPHFAIQGALALGALVAGRYYITDGKRNFSNLYFLNIADSGTGKEQAKKCLHNVLAESGHHNLITESYTSRAALVDSLDIEPNQISIIDEFGRNLEAAMQKGGSAHIRECVTAQMEIFNTSSISRKKYARVDRTKKAEPDMPILDPCLTMIGMTTPSSFFNAIDGSAITDGTLPRFIIAHSEVEPNRRMLRDAAQTIPSALIDWVRHTLDHTVTAHSGNLAGLAVDATLRAQTQTVHIPDDVWQLFNDCKGVEFQLRGIAKETGVEAMVNRMTQKAMRVALIIAVSVDPDSPKIDKDAAQWAIDYVTFCEKNALELVNKNLVEGRIGPLIKKMSDYIKRGEKRGRTDRDLRRAFGGHGREYDEALKAIQVSGRASLVDQSKGGRGRKRLAFVADGYLKTDDNIDE